MDHCFISRYALRFRIALLFLVVAGCGGPKGPSRHAMHGTVSVAGTPIAAGSLSFFPAQGNAGPAATAAIVNGRYAFTSETGPYSGPHRVLIDAAPTASAVPTYDIKAPGSRPPEAMTTPAKTHWELEFDIPANASEKNFDLPQ